MTSVSNRNSFFDDDDLSIMFDWEKFSDTRLYKDILNHVPLDSDTFNRSLANSQAFMVGYFKLFPRCIVQFKVRSASQIQI